MPRSHVLITGGAGFIGSHLSDELLEHGYRVRALDSMSDQVHGDASERPDYLAADVELIRGDVRDPATVRRALDGVDAVVHFAAAVGVGQEINQRNAVVRRTCQGANDKVEISRSEARPTIRPDHERLL